MFFRCVGENPYRVYIFLSQKKGGIKIRTKMCRNHNDFVSTQACFARRWQTRHLGVCAAAGVALCQLAGGVNYCVRRADRGEYFKCLRETVVFLARNFIKRASNLDKDMQQPRRCLYEYRPLLRGFLAKERRLETCAYPSVVSRRFAT